MRDVCVARHFPRGNLLYRGVDGEEECFGFFCAGHYYWGVWGFGDGDGMRLNQGCNKRD